MNYDIYGSCAKTNLKEYDDRDEQGKDGKEEHQVKGIQGRLEHLLHILTLGLISDGFSVIAKEGFEDQCNEVIQDGTTKPSTKGGNKSGEDDTKVIDTQTLQSQMPRANSKHQKWLPRLH